MNKKLWEQLNEWKKECTWVELSHEVSPNTPHWDGFPDMSMKTTFDFDTTIFQVHEYTLVSQYGTHVDAPVHFVQGANTLESFTPKDMVMPLCVIDKSQAVVDNHDYVLTKEDILDWEKENGIIPEGAFVAFRTDWYKRETSEKMDNRDADGNKHYPCWGIDALKFLIEERNVAAVGHEQSDTDAPVVIAVDGYIGEYYVLSKGRFQIELLKNLDKCPAVGALIFTTFPKVKNGAGFTARCFAICPK